MLRLSMLVLTIALTHVLSIGKTRSAEPTPFFDPKAELWGYEAAAGLEQGIAPRYQLAAPFYEGLAAVKVDDKFGFINSSGELKIPARYERAGRFSEGLAGVRIDGSCGYINKSGEWVIPPQFDSCAEFSSGVAAVKTAGKVGYIDTRGEIVIRPEYLGGDRFVDNLAPVRTKEGWGYIDKRGQVKIAPQFASAQPFSGGVAGVCKNDGGFSYIRSSGNFAWEDLANLKSGHPFVGGLAAVEKPEGGMCLMNRDGRFVTDWPIRELRVTGINAAVGHSADDGAADTTEIVIRVLPDGRPVMETRTTERTKSVRLHSTPEGASVYLIPLYFYEGTLDEDSLLKDEYRVPGGNTNTTTSADGLTVYMVVFVRQDKRERRQCCPSTTPVVSVVFP